MRAGPKPTAPDRPGAALGRRPAPAALHEVVDRLARRFPDVPRPSLAELVELAHEQYRAATVRTFVPLLVEKQVVAALRTPAVPPPRFS